MTRHTALALFVSSVLFACPGAASGQSVEELEGVWMRPGLEGGENRYLHLQVNGDGALEGPMVNPPLAEEGIGCSLVLRLDEDGKVVGEATWTEQQWAERAAWEFTIASADELRGRSEWLDWEEGKVWERGWDEHSLVRVPRVGWVTEGEGEAPFGDEVEDLTALQGGWLGPHGDGWALTVDGDRVTLRNMDVSSRDLIHSHRTLNGTTTGPMSVPLVHERGTFRGVVQIGGVESQVELAYDAAEGVLVGRASWQAGPVQGWSPLRFTRLPRAEQGPAEASAEAPAASGATPHGVWKRDDGLYLRLRPEGQELVGELVERSGAVTARLRLQQQAGVWSGPANWGSYETTWELSLSEEDGTLSGRGQWVDLHEGQVVARGWSGRTFSALRRVQ